MLGQIHPDPGRNKGVSTPSRVHVTYSQGDGDFLLFLFCSKKGHCESRFYWLLNLIDELNLELVMINWEWG